MPPADLETLLSSRRTEDRLRATKQLARGGGPVALLLRALNDRSHYVAAVAAEALAECATEEHADLLLRRFEYLGERGPQRDPGCHIRSHLAFALGRLEHTPAGPALQEGIRTVQLEAAYGGPEDTAAPLRGNCALALAQIRGPDAVRDISRLLFGNEAEMLLPDEPEPQHTQQERKYAAQALAHCGNREARVPLGLKLIYPGNEDADVLQECMQAVVELRDPHATELLRPYLTHRDPHLVAFAALMIARTGDPEAPTLIVDALDNLSGDPLRAALLALTTLRDEAAREVLRELVYHPRETLRLALATVLADLRHEIAGELLNQLAASDTSNRVRSRAQQSLASRAG